MEFKLKDNNANNHFINQYNENLSTLIKLRSEFISLKARLSKAEETLESFKAQKTNDYKYYLQTKQDVKRLEKEIEIISTALKQVSKSEPSFNELSYDLNQKTEEKAEKEERLAILELNDKNYHNYIYSYNLKIIELKKSLAMVELSLLDAEERFKTSLKKLEQRTGTDMLTWLLTEGIQEERFDGIIKTLMPALTASIEKKEEEQIEE